jgi:4-alpha-glucanotransferase
LRSLGVATFKIPQWENYDDGRSIAGSDYQRVSVATYATHDHKPLRALWQEAFAKTGTIARQAQHDLAKIAAFTGVPPPNAETDFDNDFYAPVMEALFRSDSWIAIVMITDLLARKDRFNVPGTAANTNWSRRMQKTGAGLDASPTIQKRIRVIRELLEKTGRVWPRMNTDFHG